ncbi:MAG: hypothetical protein RLT05_34125 [Bauldia litoralis]
MRRITRAVFGAMLLVGATAAPARAAIVCINGTLFSVTPGLGSFNLGTPCGGSSIDLRFLRQVLLHPLGDELHRAMAEIGGIYDFYPNLELYQEHLEELLGLQKIMINAGVNPEAVIDEAGRQKLQERLNQQAAQLGLKVGMLQTQLQEQQQLETQKARLEAANHGGFFSNQIAELDAKIGETGKLQQEVSKLFKETQGLSLLLQATGG